MQSQRQQQQQQPPAQQLNATEAQITDMQQRMDMAIRATPDANPARNQQPQAEHEVGHVYRMPRGIKKRSYSTTFGGRRDKNEADTDQEAHEDDDDSDDDDEGAYYCENHMHICYNVSSRLCETCEAWYCVECGGWECKECLLELVHNHNTHTTI